jgi:hypothetical protein
MGILDDLMGQVAQPTMLDPNNPQTAAAPAQAAQQQALIDQLKNAAESGGKIQARTRGQAIAQGGLGLVQGLLSGYENAQKAKGTAGAAADKAALVQQLINGVGDSIPTQQGGGDASPDAAPSSTPASVAPGSLAGAIEASKPSIAAIESGGNQDPYSVQGPVTEKGDRAEGKYQVMASNVPQWTKETLGTALSPQEFLGNPKAQEAVFAKKFGDAILKYGSPADAASVWFTGRPQGAASGGAKDSLGTTGNQYVQKFMANYLKNGGGLEADSDNGAPVAHGVGLNSILPGASNAPTPDANQTPALAYAPKTIADLLKNGGIPTPPPRPDGIGTDAGLSASDSADESSPAAAVASALKTPATSAPTAAQTPGRVVSPYARPEVMQAAAKILQNPYAADSDKTLAMSVIQKGLESGAKQYSEPYNVPGIGMVQRGADGQLHQLTDKTSEKLPTSVQEFQYAQTHPDYAAAQKANKVHVLGSGAIQTDDSGKVLARNDGSNGGQGGPLSNPDREMAAQFLAKRLEAGDRTATIGVSRDKELLTRANTILAQKGVDPREMMANAADFEGQKSEQRTLGVNNANMSQAATEAAGALKIARQKIADLDASDFVPLNQGVQIWQAATSNKKLAALQQALTTAGNIYARAVNPKGVPLVADKLHFDKEVNPSMGPTALNAKLDVMEQEIGLARHSPAQAMQLLRRNRAALAAANKGQLPADANQVIPGFDAGDPTAEPNATPSAPRRLRYDATGNLVPQ